MHGSVIQGSFPRGLKLPVQPQAAPSPSWVQQKIAAGGRAAPAVTQQKIAAPRLPPHGMAIALPPHLVAPSAGGQPLDAAVRQKMEAAFGHRFDDVRVHTGPHAQSIGALAFTQGSHIHFAPGQYNPATAQGCQVLAHELAHVVQQRTGRVQNPFHSGVAVVQDPALEAEAERMAQRALMAPAAAMAVQRRVARPGGAAPRVVQRAVGFEFETGWLVERAGKTFFGNTTWSAMAKKEVVARGKGFRVEADEASAEGQTPLSELEFVVDPPIQDAYDAEDEVRAILTSIGKVAASLEQQAADGKPFIVKTTEGEFRITPPKGAKVRANPQVTAGIRLDRMATLAAENDNSGIRKTLVSNSGIIDDLRGYHDLAQIAVADFDGSDTLAGFLALICHYLNCWANGNPDRLGWYSNAFEYIKMGPAFMARTDFAAMYKNLPKSDRDHFKKPSDFVGLVARITDLDLKGLVVERGVRKPTKAELTSEFLSQPNKELVWFPKVTREQWLATMAEGVDLLSGKDDPKSYEGMGALGKKVDEVGILDPVAAPIIEFRKAAGNLHYLGWADFAVNAYRYVYELNNPGERQKVETIRNRLDTIFSN